MDHDSGFRWNHSRISITNDYHFLYRFPQATGPANVHGIGSDIAIRLYRSIGRPSKSWIENNLTNLDIISQASLNAPSCRICKCGSNSETLICCPCKCSGTMGFIHLNCLNRWIRIRGSSFCEICNQKYNLPLSQRKYFKLIKRFFRPKYFGIIFTDMFNIISLTPLIYLTIGQLLEIMDASSEKSTIKLMLIGPSLLLVTSVYFFLYFDWILSCLFRIRNVFKHWWRFGDQEDDEYDEYMDFNSDDEDFWNIVI